MIESCNTVPGVLLLDVFVRLNQTEPVFSPAGRGLSPSTAALRGEIPDRVDYA